MKGFIKVRTKENTTILINVAKIVAIKEDSRGNTLITLVDVSSYVCVTETLREIEALIERALLDLYE